MNFNKTSAIVAVLMCLFSQTGYAIKKYKCSPKMEYYFNLGDKWMNAVEDIKDRFPEEDYFADSSLEGVFWNLGDETAEYELRNFSTYFKALAYDHDIPNSFAGRSKPEVYIRNDGYDLKDDPAFAIEDDIEGIVLMANADVSIIWLCKNDSFDGDYAEFFETLRAIDLKYALDDLEDGDFLEDMKSADTAEIQWEQNTLKSALSSIDYARAGQQVGFAAGLATALRAAVLYFTKNPAVAASFVPPPPSQNPFKSCDSFSKDQLKGASEDKKAFVKLKKDPQFKSCMRAIRGHQFNQFCKDKRNCL